MDCRIIDCKVVIRDGSIISITPYHFGIDERKENYYGKMIELIENQNSARVRRFEDNAISIESLGVITTRNRSLGKI